MHDSKKRPIVVIALLTAVCLLGDSMLYVALPTHYKEVGLTSLAEVFLMLSVNRFVRLPLNPLIGWLYQKISKRAGIVFAVCLAGITTSSYGFVHGVAGWVCLRALWGVAWTFLRLGANFAIVELSNDSNRGKYTGVYNGLYRLGSLFGMLLGGLLADVFGIESIARIFGVLGFLAIPLAYRFVPNSMAETPAAVLPVHTFRDRFIYFYRKRMAAVWVLGLFTALTFQGMFTATLSPLIDWHSRGISLSIGQTVIGAASIAGILQALRWGWEPFLAPWIGRISDGTYGRAPLLIGFLLTSGILFFVVSFPMPFAIWLCLLVCVQITATGLTTLPDSIASDYASKGSRIAMISTYTLAVDVGAAAGPLIASLQLSLPVLYRSAGIGLGLLTVFWYVSSMRESKSQRFNVIA